MEKPEVRRPVKDFRQEVLRARISLVEVGKGIVDMRIIPLKLQSLK